MSDGFLKKFGLGFEKTRRSLSKGLGSLFPGGKKVDSDVLDQLEGLLIGADLGVAVTDRLISDLKESIDRKEVSDLASLKERLKFSITDILEEVPPGDQVDSVPFVSIFVGVNGVGKTTTIGKRAYQLKSEGKSVLLAAADTFRAGAGGQLAIWAKRAGAEVISHDQPNADPSAVVFDAVSAALSRKVDHLLIDTAGRLQTQHNLMEELKKMIRVISKQMPDAPHKKVLVVDATTGQNALSQGEHFQNAIGLNEIILTKVDGTGKGGMIVPMMQRLSTPVSCIGVGEQINDLISFNIMSFAAALFEEGELLLP